MDANGWVGRMSLGRKNYRKTRHKLTRGWIDDRKKVKEKKIKKSGRFGQKDKLN